MKSVRPVATEPINADLQRECEVLRGLFAATTRRTVAERYEMAVRLLNIQKGAHYGESAVERAAAELGKSSRLLYDYIEVAKRWQNRDDCMRLVERRNRFGLPLTFSHLMPLARQQDWEAWAGRAVDGAWTANRLRAEIARGAGEKKKTGGRATKPSETTLAGLDEAIQDLKRLRSRMVTWKLSINRFAESPRPSPREERSMITLASTVAEAAKTMSAMQARAEQLLAAHRSDGVKAPSPSSSGLDGDSAGLLLAGAMPRELVRPVDGSVAKTDAWRPQQTADPRGRAREPSGPTA
jgi:hypothetical protein